MKGKLIKISENYYIVVDDSEIKDCYYYNLLDKVIRFGNNLNHPYHYKITHSTEPLEGVESISLSEVKEAISGYSVEKMANELILTRFNETDGYHKLVFVEAYVKGFKAHQELVKDKLFTIEDMQKAYTHGVAVGNVDVKPDFNSFIQSLLPKTEWEIEFVDSKIRLL